jgi:hypothetical protein
VADSRLLLAGLEEYRRALELHSAQLRAEYDHLDNAWRNFSSVYEGDAADQFRAGWTRTAQLFQEYIHQTGIIAGILDERIEHLRQANRTEGGLIG